MKTLQEIYSEITASDELKAAFLEAAKNGKGLDFLKEKGCETTAEELTAFLKNRMSGELSDEELDNVAGGCEDASSPYSEEALMSIFSLGVICAIEAADSANNGYVGARKEGDGRLCNYNF